MVIMMKNELENIKKLFSDKQSDQVWLTVECNRYYEEIDDVKIEYLEDGNGIVTKQVSFVFGDFGDISDDLMEWSSLVTELSGKEIDLFKCKNEYQVLSDKIIQDTDFKALYGANNQKVRDNHVKGELSDLYDEIKSLEFSIDYLTRRIMFLKELIRTKRTLMEIKE